MDTNAIIKFLIVLLGFSIVPWHSLINVSYQAEMLDALVGIMIGFCFAVFESYLINYINLNKKIKRNYELISYESVVMVGACEEILFRGVITVLCVTLLNPVACVISLFVSTIIFSLNHVSLGSEHVFSKFALGLICLFAFFYTKTIITPICIHATFNMMAMNKIRNVVYG
jgi:membrane protease YdiL (CAAX protease family)